MLVGRRSFLEASCCRVDVVNGGEGFLVVCRFSMSEIMYSLLSAEFITARALASDVRSNLSNLSPSK